MQIARIGSLAGEVLLAVALVLLGILVLAGACSPGPPPFPSGGLGLTKAEWDRQHTADPQGPQPPLNYDNARYHVFYWYDGPATTTPADARISALLRTTAPAPVEQLEAEGRTLLPADAQLQSMNKETDVEICPVQEIFRSSSLADRFPPLATAHDPWGTSPAGQIAVCYDSAGVIKIFAGLDAIPPWTPAPQSPTPTPTAVPYVSPIPTAFRQVPPPPVPSGVRLLPTAVRSTGPPPAPTVAATAAPPGASPPK